MRPIPGRSPTRRDQKSQTRPGQPLATSLSVTMGIDDFLFLRAVWPQPPSSLAYSSRVPISLTEAGVIDEFSWNHELEIFGLDDKTGSTIVPRAWHQLKLGILDYPA